MPFFAHVMQKLNEMAEVVVHMIPHPSHEGEVRIMDGEGRQFIVNLMSDWECTHRDFQDFMLPYVHV